MVVGGGGGFARVLKVKVLEISGGRVKLGFEVDADIPVRREEVWERIGASRELDVRLAREAALNGPSD